MDEGKNYARFLYEGKSTNKLPLKVGGSSLKKRYSKIFWSDFLEKDPVLLQKMRYGWQNFGPKRA
jgi:hypothetical protein